MAQTFTLKEFLVALGFKIDDSKYKKFTDSIAGATKAVNTLGIATAITETSLMVMMARVSEAMEKMYFAAQRTGSAVAAMKGFDYAVSNLGGSADSAQASLENLAHFIRSYPGSAEFLEKLGVAPEHVHDAVAAMRDLSVTFQHMPFWQAQPFANVLGIDEKTLLAMQSGQLTQQLQNYDNLLRSAGVNSAEAARRSNEFQTALRGVGAASDIAYQGLMTIAGPLIWILHYVQALEVGIARLTQHPLKALGSGLYNYIFDHGAYLKNVTEAGGFNAPSASTTTSSWQKTVDYFKSKGWSDAQAIGIAANLQAESNFNPGAVGDHNTAYGIAQWHKDRRAAFKAWAGHDIYGSSLDQQLAFMQYELTQGGEKSAGAKLRGATNAYDAGRLFSDFYERPALSSEGDIRGRIAQNAAASVNQTNNFNITGSDPQAIAAAVSTRQNEVNNQLVRNMQGAIQ